LNSLFIMLPDLLHQDNSPARLKYHSIKSCMVLFIRGYCRVIVAGID